MLTSRSLLFGMGLQPEFEHGAATVRCGEALQETLKKGWRDGRVKLIYDLPRSNNRRTIPLTAQIFFFLFSMLFC